MELAGFALDGPVRATPYADVHTGRRLLDDAPVRVEVLRGADPARLREAETALRRADGRHLVRVRQVLTEPPALVREHVPAQPLVTVDPVRVVADVLDALASLHEQGAEFSPPPDAVVEPDAVVRFDVRALQPGGTTTWAWVARLPEALSRTALPRLAQDVEAARAARERAVATPAPAGPAPSPTS